MNYKEALKKYKAKKEAFEKANPEKKFDGRKPCKPVFLPLTRSDHEIHKYMNKLKECHAVYKFTLPDGSVKYMVCDDHFRTDVKRKADVFDSQAYNSWVDEGKPEDKKPGNTKIDKKCGNLTLSDANKKAQEYTKKLEKKEIEDDKADGEDDNEGKNQNEKDGKDKNNEKKRQEITLSFIVLPCRCAF